MHDSDWTLKTLCKVAGVSPRTVRYYIQQGLIPPPDRAGPGATYGQGHVDRLLLILRLKDQHLPLAEIRSRISALQDGEVAEMLATSTDPPPDSAADYVRAVLGGTRFSASSPSPASPPRAHRTQFAQSSVSLSTSPQPPRRSTWERHCFTEDIELHIRRPLSRSQDKQVRMLINLGRKLLSKDNE